MCQGYACKTTASEPQLQRCCSRSRAENRADLLVYLKSFMEDGLSVGRITQDVFDKIARKNAEKVLKL